MARNKELIRYKLLIQNGYSHEEAEKLKTRDTIDVTGYNLTKNGELKVTRSRKFKLDKDARAKIRYQLYRDAGFSVQEARKFRYQSYIDISGIRLDKNGKIVKKNNYNRVKNSIEVDHIFTKMRKVPNESVFSQHGMLLSDKRYKGEYNKAIEYIKKRDNLSYDKAYYFAHFMLTSGYSYEFTRRELLSSREFEIYVSKKHKSSKSKRSKK